MKLPDIIKPPRQALKLMTREEHQRAQERQRQREAAESTRQLTPKLKLLDGWEGLIGDQAARLGVPVADVMAILVTYDAWVAAGGFDPFPPGDLLSYEVKRTYSNRRSGGRERTVTDHYDTEPADTVQMIAEHVMSWLRQKLAPAVGKIKQKRYRRTKEAIRKARARAAGRVKPRAKKGPPSIPARIAATEASLATRRAKLAALKGNPNWYLVSVGDVMRTETGIKRTEKTLATYKAKLSTGDNGG
jgi:hypothetical protein